MNTSLNTPPAELYKGSDIINIIITQNIAFDITSLHYMPSINRTYYWPLPKGLTALLEVWALAEAGIRRGQWVQIPLKLQSLDSRLLVLVFKCEGLFHFDNIVRSAFLLPTPPPLPLQKIRDKSNKSLPYLIWLKPSTTTWSLQRVAPTAWHQHLVTNRQVHCREEYLSIDSTATAYTQWLLN